MNFLLNTIIASITAGTPLLLATLGEIVTEKGGIINLGLEGLMLVGALIGFSVSHYTNNAVIGLCAAIVAGGFFSLLHAFLTITLACNQIVSGLALTILGMGVTSFFGRRMVGQTAPGFKPIVLDFDIIVFISLVLVFVVWFIIHRTRWGLYLSACGENPVAADAMGVNVSRIRYTGVVSGGMLVSMGGAYLSLAYTPMWVENMVAGKGWIAIALVIFAMWDPLKAVLGAYLFGAVVAIILRVQALGGTIPINILNMTPYIVIILVLIIITVFEDVRRKLGAPQALGSGIRNSEFGIRN